MCLRTTKCIFKLILFRINLDNFFLGIIQGSINHGNFRNECIVTKRRASLCGWRDTSARHAVECCLLPERSATRRKIVALFLKQYIICLLTCYIIYALSDAAPQLANTYQLHHMADGDYSWWYGTVSCAALLHVLLATKPHTSPHKSSPLHLKTQN